jgi:hypothetical protein
VVNNWLKISTTNQIGASAEKTRTALGPAERAFGRNDSWLARRSHPSRSRRKQRMLKLCGEELGAWRNINARAIEAKENRPKPGPMRAMGPLPGPATALEAHDVPHRPSPAPFEPRAQPCAHRLQLAVSGVVRMEVAALGNVYQRGPAAEQGRSGHRASAQGARDPLRVVFIDETVCRRCLKESSTRLPQAKASLMVRHCFSEVGGFPPEEVLPGNQCQISFILGP